jgi:hypothetical protein
MNLPTEPDGWTVEIANAQREEALAAFGFTERQARFLALVLVHSGVFVERQYCSFAGIVHGQKSTDFINLLVERRYGTPIATGRLHRGRMFHVHYKPLWAAIGEPNSRFRKPAAPGRMIERVMILDAVLEGRDFVWLGTAIDKRRHLMRYLGDRLPKSDYPQLSFGDGEAKVVRYFPDKLPIGVQPHSHPHVLLYLVTHPSPMDFRLFLLRHMALLTVLPRWTVRLLVPRQLKRAQLLYLRAAREHLAEPLHPSAVEEMEWYFRERQRRAAGDQPATDHRFERAASAFCAPRFRALYRHWLAQGANALWVARSTQTADALERDHGRIECVELSRQYLHLSRLVDVA